jgi:hypothetical protein
MAEGERTERRNGGQPNHGNLSIPLPFDDAIRAALEVKPKGKVGNGKPAAKSRKKPAKKG